MAPRKTESQATDLVKKVWQMADVLAGQGIGYTDYLTQLTYLLFLKMDFEVSGIDGTSRIPEQYRWPTLIEQTLVGKEQKLLPDEQLEHYEEILAALSRDDYPDEFVRSIFAKAQNKINKAQYLAKVIDMINQLAQYIAINGAIMSPRELRELNADLFRQLYQDFGAEVNRPIESLNNFLLRA